MMRVKRYAVGMVVLYYITVRCDCGCSISRALVWGRVGAVLPVLTSYLEIGITIS
jgi:hypothetical protein